jgi:protein-L-isoaspartate(D-aspartate) O-methyltransferase
VASAEQRRRLVDKLQAASAIRSDAVREAFLSVPREVFIPRVAQERGVEAVYEDEAYPTKTDGRGLAISASSQPFIMAAMLEALRLRPGQRVLEIGAGTGYNAALLSAIVGRRGRVTSVELDPQLAAAAGAAVGSVGHHANVVVGDGRDGWPPDAPYDGIVATASSLEVPPAFLQQLREGGLLVLPLRLTDALPFRQVVVTFERVGPRLRSMDVITGGFMRMRDRPDDPSVPWPEARAVETRDGSEQTIASLSGSTLSLLSAPDRRRLLALLLSPPRSRRLGVRASGQRQWDLETFVALAADEDRLVGCARAELGGLLLFNIALPGILDTDHDGIAYLAGSKTVSRIDAHGARGPARQLGKLVDRWLARGRPSIGDLRIVVEYDPPTSRHWRTTHRGSAYLCFDWHGGPGRD